MRPAHGAIVTPWASGRVGLEASGEERSEAAAKPDDAHLGEVADEQLGRRSRIGEVIEPEVTRTFYVQLAGDDLTLVA